MTSVPETEDSMFNWPGFSHSPLQWLLRGFHSSMYVPIVRKPYALFFEI